MKMKKYQEIQDLYAYCKELNISCKIEPLFDGFRLTLPGGGDFAQHFGTYCPDCCVEPAIGCDRDYSACTLSTAKGLIDKYYKREVKSE